MQNKRNVFIDIIKYLCAVEVIWMHSVNISPSLNQIMQIINTIFMKITTILPPVELFFVISGYYLFLKKPDSKRVITWEKKLYITYFLYSFLYLRQITEHFAGRSFILNVLSVIRQFFFTGYSIMGWFIPALAWGVMVVYGLGIIEKKIGTRLFSRLIIGVLSILSAIGSTYYYVFPNNIMDIFIKLTGGIGILRGIIYVYIGYELAEFDIEKQIKKSELLLAAGLWCVMTILAMYSQENGLGINTRGMITKYMYVFELSLIIMKLSKKEIFTKMNGCNLGKISLVMYFTHVFILEHFVISNYPLLCFFVAVLGSTFIGELIVKGREKGIRIFKYYL